VPPEEGAGEVGNLRRQATPTFAQFVGRGMEGSSRARPRCDAPGISPPGDLNVRPALHYGAAMTPEGSGTNEAGPGKQLPRFPFPPLGPRGEGWVVLQVLAAGLVAAAGVLGPAWPSWAAPLRQIAALVAAVLGAALGVTAGVALGRQVTPLPRPVAGGALREKGAYRLARHPMYGGGLLLGLAYALATSALVLVALAAAAAFVDLKRRMEEAWLLAQHPAYAEYRRRVRWRIIPFLW